MNYLHILRMVPRTYRYLAGIGLMLILVFIPDVVFHSLLSLGHVVFEFVEYSLDQLVEHLFHTTLHQTQVIVFYILLAIGAAAAYGLWRVLPGLTRRTKAMLLAVCMEEKARALAYWGRQCLVGKIKLVGTLAAGVTFVFFLAFS